MRHTPVVLTMITALLALPACDSDPADLDRAEVAGEYEATTFVGQEDGDPIDVLDAGGSITVELDADGTTSGTMFIPGGEEDGSDLTADLDGTWSIDGDEVTFDHDADTIVRDMVFSYEDGRLIAASADVQLVLTRQ